jgi:hypothetical protein
MRADFEAQKVQVEHRGLTGRAREATLAAEYLEKYLPGSMRLRRNVEIVATDGSRSPECDIVICDARTPPLWTAGDVEVMPIECVYAVIEVKSRLDGRELDDSWRKIRTIKAMPKTAWLREVGLSVSLPVYGRIWKYTPVAGFVFAYESIDLGNLADRLLERAVEDNVPPHLCVDGVYVLNGGSLNWGDATQPWQTPIPGRRTVRHIKPLQGRSILPMMTLHLQGILGAVFGPRFDLGAYFGNMTLGTIVGAASDETDFPTDA